MLAPAPAARKAFGRTSSRRARGAFVSLAVTEDSLRPAAGPCLLAGAGLTTTVVASLELRGWRSYGLLTSTVTRYSPGAANVCRTRAPAAVPPSPNDHAYDSEAPGLGSQEPEASNSTGSPTTASCGPVACTSSVKGRNSYAPRSRRAVQPASPGAILPSSVRGFPSRSSGDSKSLRGAGSPASISAEPGSR